MPLPISEHALYLAHRAVSVGKIFDIARGCLSLTRALSVISENVVTNHT